MGTIDFCPYRASLILESVLMAIVSKPANFTYDDTTHFQTRPSLFILVQSIHKLHLLISNGGRPPHQKPTQHPPPKDP